MVNYSFFITLFISGLIIMFAASNISCDNPLTKKDCENVSVLGNIIGFLFMIFALLGFISLLMPRPDDSQKERKTPI